MLNASEKIKPVNVGETVLSEAIKQPFYTIINNADIIPPIKLQPKKGINVVTGDVVDMIKSGIIDPVLVTKTALKNAVSVAKTIISADCVISNKRVEEDASS